jgi:dTMP kinase
MFIVFEGIDGSGKSTQAKLLYEYLRSEGYACYLTSEPTDSIIGATIRNIFNHRIQADQHTIAALFAADRLDHLQNAVNGILKKLNEGNVVICDRYYFSSYAYHGVHVDMNWVIQMNSVASELLKADLTFHIQMPPKASLERIRSGRSSTELYETLENLKSVAEKYEEAYQKAGKGENIHIINGTMNIQSIQEQIRNIVKEKLTQK